MEGGWPENVDGSENEQASASEYTHSTHRLRGGGSSSRTCTLTLIALMPPPSSPQVDRYLKKATKDPRIRSAVGQLALVIEAAVRQNNTVDVFEVRAVRCACWSSCACMSSDAPSKSLSYPP